MKRFFDVFAGLAICFVTSPVWVLSFIIILLHDPGPVFFRQRRVGMNEKEFYIVKFRTMYISQRSSSATTMEKDSRVFRGGHFLRKFKIDEMPQILNVIGGSMSLVGPRPTVRDDVDKMTYEQKRRFSVRPGITGLAQISGNTSIPWGERIRYDLEYIDNFSVWWDLIILIKTVLLVVSGRADTHPPSDDEWGK
ncbi:sugar transferase [Chromohalobacter nigrandesensis]|uniref:sugar transferase n=1 Tax=Chromohalobacter nigrandesensis TaxID=119863 RepID=UPI001FF541C4|nr:sugar transferase [Chromohalobacter nigrandesensis]MCK0743676.1 sugar transferase [Chromohalobacter nigrandesensis]